MLLFNYDRGEIMKKIIVLVLFILLLVGCGSKNEENTIKDEQPKKYESLLEYGDYKNIKLENIEKLTKIRYTVAGADEEELTRDDITIVYNTLKGLKIGEETSMACEDNTTIYRFVMKDGNKYSVEIECDWFVINKKRYNIVK